MVILARACFLLSLCLPLSSRTALVDNDQSNNPHLRFCFNAASECLQRQKVLAFKGLGQTEAIHPHLFPLNFIFAYDGCLVLTVLVIIYDW